MIIGMINGSPKLNDSASVNLSEEIAKLLTEGNEIITINVNNTKTDALILEEVYRCDAIVFSFPLYVDGVPSHFLRFMEDLQRYIKLSDKKEIFVYTIVNCGFYEGKQAILALQIVENWCERAGLRWGMGVGVGAGPMAMSVKSVPIGYGPKKNLGTALSLLAETIKRKGSTSNIFTTMNFPRFAYILAAHTGWTQGAKQNGMRKKDLFRQ